MFIRQIAFFLLFVSSNCNAQGVNFVADVNEMSPMSYPAQYGLTDFTFQIRNDSAFVRLPYMGNVYNPTLDNEGLNFGAPCNDLKESSTTKNDAKIIHFTLNRNIVTYRFRVTLYNNEQIDIFMQPSNAQSCSYRGTWTEITSQQHPAN